MKSPLRRLRGFGHNHPKERRGHQPPPAKLDELVSAGQVRIFPLFLLGLLLGELWGVIFAAHDAFGAKIGSWEAHRPLDFSRFSVWQLELLCGFPGGVGCSFLGWCQFSIIGYSVIQRN